MGPVDASIVQPRYAQRISEQWLRICARVKFVRLGIPGIEVVARGDVVVDLDVALIGVVLLAHSIGRNAKTIRQCRSSRYWIQGAGDQCAEGGIEISGQII